MTWFESYDHVEDAVFVRRVAREESHMELTLQTLAELLKAAGCILPVQIHDTTREVELAFEKNIHGSRFGAISALARDIGN